MGKNRKVPDSKPQRRPQEAGAAGGGLVDRRSVVRISDTVNRKFKNLLQSTPGIGVGTRETSHFQTERKAAVRLFSIYKSLREFGFADAQIEQMLHLLPQNQITLDAALDWMMLNVPVEMLPKCFTRYDAVYSTKNIIEVVKKTHPRVETADSRETDAMAMPQSTEPTRAVTLPRKKGDSRWQQSKEWIMKYCEEISDDSASSDNQQVAESNEEAEWAIWSDPREVERRKLERTTDGVGDLEKSQLLTHEIEKVREVAAKAKATKDIEKQKLTGQMMKALKTELEALDGEGALSDNILQKAASKEKDKIESESSGSETSLVGHVFEMEEAEPEHQSVPQPEAVSPEPRVAQRAALFNEDEGVDLGDMLFGSAADWELKTPSPLFDHNPPKPTLEVPSATVTPLTEEGKQINLALERWRQAHMPIKIDHQRLPKFVLMHNCQKKKWGIPSFQKLPRTYLLHSVSVTVPAQRRKSAADVEGGSHKVVVPLEYSPGSVQEAQNCVAIVALMRLFPNLNLDQTFQEPYREVHYQLKKYGATLETVEDDAVKSFIMTLIKERELGQEQANPNKRSLPKGPSADMTAATELQLGFRRLDPRLDDQLRRQFLDFCASSEGETWNAQRQSLPVNSIKAAVLETMEHHSACVVVGDTGCGKTTQIPQFLYEQAVLSHKGSICNILITQPRRLAAISVAQRIAEEMGQSPPVSQRHRSQRRSSRQKKNSGLVGYHVRLDAAIGPATRLTFCTTGILLRLLTGDPWLSEVSHVIVDEVHERTMHSDFLLAILKDLVIARAQTEHPLKVVLMSATMDADLFARYMGCPQLTTSGRTFPVEVSFLEDVYELIQYKLDPESDAAQRAGGQKSLKASIKNKASSRAAKQLLESGWGDEASTASDIPNRSYKPELYADFSETTRRSLQLANEDRIDYDLIEQLIVHIDRTCAEGAILVFLPGETRGMSQRLMLRGLGMYEINVVFDRLSGRRQFERDWLIRLHSSVPPEEQSRAFAIPPRKSNVHHGAAALTLADFIDMQTTPVISDSTQDNTRGADEGEKVRKIVISTNIAETSLTIGDVVYVVDTGKVRERRFDAARGISALEETWISKASAQQRKGRAGRVQSGYAFRLYTRDRHEMKMSAFQVPEIVRMPLEEIILQIHSLGLGRARQFLETLPQPPDGQATKLAVESLTQIGALEAEVEELTPLGRILSMLPIDARIGKLLVYASYFRCLPAALTLAAAMGERSIFNTRLDMQGSLRQIKHKIAATGVKMSAVSTQQSDHLLIIAAFHGWLELRTKDSPAKAHQYAVENMLHEPTLEIIRELRLQFAEILAQVRLIEDPEIASKPKNENTSMVRALLVASMYPNVCTLELPETGPVRCSPYWSDGRSAVELHKSSINAELPPSDFHYPFLVYLEKVKTHQLMIRESTVVSPIALLLFGGNLHVQHHDSLIVIDDRIRLRAAAPVAVMFKKLRITLDDLILKKIQDPTSGTQTEDELLDIVETLLTDEEYSRKK